MAKRRIIYYDFLRIVAIFGIVMIHVSAENWYTTVVDNNWLCNNFMNNIVETWPKGMFVAISGAIFLANDKINFNNLLKKYICRIGSCLIVWHTIYYFYSSPNFSIQNLKHCIKSLLLGNTYSHLWYLYLVIGLYMLTPILSKMVKALSKRELEYGLILGVAVTLFAQTLGSFVGFDLTALVKPYVVLDFNRYLIYYILGYYVDTYGLPHFKKIFYASIIALLGLIAYENIMCIEHSQVIVYNISFLGVLITSSAFVYAKNTLKDKENKCISELGRLTFGVYLIHFIVEKELLKLGVNANMINPILGNILVSLLVFSISYVISFVLSKIPIVKKIVL